jgi:hypothetical protein
MKKLTKNAKRTYLKYLAVPEAMIGRLSDGVFSEGLPINQDLSSAEF